MVFVNLGPYRCVLVREVSSFQRVKCVVFVNLEPCRCHCVLIREVFSLGEVSCTRSPVCVRGRSPSVYKGELIEKYDEMLPHH